MGSFDLVSSLQALPETNPIEVDGIQFGGHSTCSINGGQCLLLLTNVATVCAIFASC